MKSFETDASNGSDATLFGNGGFSAVKCGRKFVWYEIGDRYFAAAGVSKRDYLITSAKVDTYNAADKSCSFLEPTVQRIVIFYLNKSVEASHV